MLKAIIKGQIIFLPTSSIIAGDTVDKICASFTFSKEWTGLIKIAYFEKDKKTIPFLLKDDFIYKEDGFNLSSGRWQVSVRGYEQNINDNIDIIALERDGYARLTTGIAAFTVIRTTEAGSSTPEEGLKNWVEKIYTESSAAIGIAKELERKLKDGEFGSGTGEGKPGASAYEIAIKNGFIGSEQEWLESLKASDSIELIEDTEDSFVLKLITSQGVIITPNLRQVINLDNIRKVADTNYWQQNRDYIPKAGELIIYTDGFSSTSPTGIPVTSAALKIGDGYTNVENLIFINGGGSVLSHKLTIGNFEFDGSKDIIIPVYRGQIN